MKSINESEILQVVDFEVGDLIRLEGESVLRRVARRHDGIDLEIFHKPNSCINGAISLSEIFEYQSYEVVTKKTWGYDEINLGDIYYYVNKYNRVKGGKFTDADYESDRFKNTIIFTRKKYAKEFLDAKLDFLIQYNEENTCIIRE